MMNQFNQDVRRLDRTTAAQQAEIEAECGRAASYVSLPSQLKAMCVERRLDKVWEQEHGKPPPT